MTSEDPDDTTDTGIVILEYIHFPLVPGTAENEDALTIVFDPFRLKLSMMLAVREDSDKIVHFLVLLWSHSPVLIRYI